MRVKNILISQPEPKDNKSPFFDLAEKYNVKVSFKKFIQVEKVPAIDFLKEQIKILDHSAIIMTSRTAIENFFRICKNTRVEVPADMKFFRVSDLTLSIYKNLQLTEKGKYFFPKLKTNPLRS